MTEISELIGKTLKLIAMNDEKDEILFEAVTGEEYRMLHYSDCCECVELEEIIGDLNDLIGAPILTAEEVTNENETPDGTKAPEYAESYTWTFYKLSTIKGYVTLRWYGSSNGYYSEGVDFERVSS